MTKFVVSHVTQWSGVHTAQTALQPDAVYPLAPDYEPRQKIG